MDNLLRIIAEISGKKKEEINPVSNLNTLKISSSIGILKLQSALEREFKKKLSPLSLNMNAVMIAKQLGVKVNDNQIKAEKNVKAEKQSIKSYDVEKYKSNLVDFFLGVDIEEVENLPKAANFRTHEFYSTQFNDAELSYTMLMPDPYIHLCGMFCAKESLKKSAPELIDIPMNEIIVSHNSAKRPAIRTTHNDLNLKYQFKVSISHTEKYATATVIAIGKQNGNG